ncbi:MAG TPA: hypothetical protein VLC74_00465 [Rhizomicrobium sp.]|nr:hypothetical protein [Rhizomicrobium sp.]
MSDAARADQRGYPAGGWRRRLVLAQCCCREATAHLLRFLKPNAVDALLIPLRTDELDGHVRAAGGKSNNVTRLEGLVSHGQSPAVESQKRESVSRQNGSLIAKPVGLEERREPQLRLGDITQLNSGGPRMMVVDIENDGIVAAWRDNDGAALEGEFPASCVQRVSPLG